MGSAERLPKPIVGFREVLAGDARHVQRGQRVLPQSGHQHLEHDPDHLARLEGERLLTPLPGTEAQLAEDITGVVDPQGQLLPPR